MAWHEETDEGFGVGVICCFVDFGVDVCFWGGEESAVAVEGEFLVFLAQEAGYGHWAALVDLGCVESDADVDEEDGVEEGLAADGGDFLGFC